MTAEEVKGKGGVGETLGKAGTTVKDGIVGSLKGMQEIEAEIVNLTRKVVTDSLKATGSVAQETINVSKDVFKGAIEAADQMGTGLMESTKSVAKGILLAVKDVGGDTTQAATNLVKRGGRAAPQRSAATWPWWPRVPSPG